MEGEQVNFVINLAHRVDRRVEMKRQLSRIGWDAVFFPAIRPTSAANFPSVGARGCFLSHLAVLKEAGRRRVRRLIILEDDVNFITDFSWRWPPAMGALESPREWSIFYPGHANDRQMEGLSLISPTTGVQCAHFMVINGHAIPHLVEGLETILARPAGHPLGGPMHVDGAYSTIRAQRGTFITYAHFPVLGYQRASRTDIGNLRWFDRIGALAPAMNIARKLKTRYLTRFTK
jgi:glycosyl transferase family 25